MFQKRPKQGGGFLLKVTKFPKILGAFGADFSLFIQEIHIQTLVFELFGAAGEILSIFTRFLSDFAVKNDDFQRKH